MVKKFLLATLPLLTIAATEPPPTTDPARLSDMVKELASDEFAGRAPGTEGEKRTIEWAIARFKSLGLEPAGPDGSWTQRVPLIHTRLGNGPMRFGDATIAQGTDVSLTTVRHDRRIAINAAPLVFVGYGVNAADAKWDDFKGPDLKGKVAVFLVNDPDFEALAGDDAAGRFGDKRMTYYGRWTYKYKEAAGRGAAAALIIHDTAGAGLLSI